MLGFLKRYEEEIPAIVAVEQDMDPTLKKAEPRRLHVVESIPHEIKTEKRIEKKPGHSEVTEYKMPTAVLEYLDGIIRNPGPGRNGISVSALKFDIEDDESLYTVISKIEKARKLKVLTEGEVNDIFEELGIRENITNTVEDIKVDEYVNWTLNNHEFEWEKPRRVRMVDIENGVAFVEGSNAKYLLENLKKVPVLVESQLDAKENTLEPVDTPHSVDEQAIEETVEHQEAFKIGDEVVFEGETKIIKKIDKDWVELEGGPLVARSEFEEKLKNPTSELKGEFDREEELFVRHDVPFEQDIPPIISGQIAQENTDSPVPESIVEPISKVEINPYIAESEVDGLYAYTIQKFDANPFTIEDFAKSDGLEGFTEEGEATLLEIFDILIQRGKLKKEGDKYVAVLEDSLLPVSDGSPKMTKVAIPNEDYNNTIDDTFVGPLPEEPFVGPMPEEKFVGPLPEAVRANDFVGPMPEIVPNKSIDDAFVGPMPEKITSSTVVDDTFVGPLPEEPFVGPLTEKLVVEQPPTLTPEQIAEQEALDFKKAQGEYAKLLVEHNHKTREKKNVWYRLMSDLGIESDKHKKLAEQTKTPEYIEAERVYTEAKQRKAEKFFGQDEIKKYEKQGGTYSLREGQEYKFNTKLFEEVKKDFDNLQNLIEEGTPERQQAAAARALVWLNKKVPPPVRVVALASIIGVGVGMFSGMGIFGAAAYGGWRATKGLAGLGMSKSVGMGMDKYYAGKNAESKEEIFSKFAKDITAENYLEKQKALEEEMAKQQNKEKKQILKKAGAMALTGGVTTALLGGVWKPTLSQAVENPGGNMRVNVPEPTSKGGFFSSIKKIFTEGPGDETKPLSSHTTIPDERITPSSPIKAPGVPSDMNLKTGMLNSDAAKIPNLSENNPILPEAPEGYPVKVELSSKGFIQTLDDMKKQLADKYAGKEMPKGVKEFIEKPSTKLAQDYGFYDASKGASGFGLKGEHLVLDEKGNLSFEHLDGKKIDPIDTTEHKFAGKMVETNKTASIPGEEKYIDEPSSKFEVETGQTQDNVLGTELTPDLSRPIDEIVSPSSDVSSIPKSLEEKLFYSSSTKNYLVPFNIDKAEFSFQNAPGGKTVELVYAAGSKKLPIAEFIPSVDGKGGALTLLDKYQDGKNYGLIRQAFAKTQEAVLADSKPIGKTVESLNFEQGKIQVVRGLTENGTENPNAVKVILNGKEIAKGIVDSKGSHVKIFENLKGGLFLADTAYERAFKVAEKTIKSMKLVK